MDNSLCIFQCGNQLTKDTATDEHVILNAIGGRKTVTGFICNTCNSKTGSSWDAELAGQLNPLSLLLGIKRQRGIVPSQKFPTSSGGAVELHFDRGMWITRPSYELTTHGNMNHLHIRARSEKELARMFRGFQRKYPSLRKVSVDDVLSTARVRSHYNPDFVQIPVEIGGREAGRSLVKSALALVHDAGVDPKMCDFALNYLTAEDVQPCFGYYYSRDKDLVTNRPAGKFFHCVYVKGNPESGTILGYVEFYGLHRMVLCLSKSFFGEAFTNLYAIDPIRGEELLLDIDLNLSISDIRSVLDGQKYDGEVLMTVIDNIFRFIIEADFKKEFRRVRESAWEKALESFDAGNDEYLTNEDIRQLVARFIEELTPFLRHNIERFRRSPREFSASSRSREE